MTPASLFIAVALASPTPAQLMDAEALIRIPELPAIVAELDRPALLAIGRRLELIGPGEVYAIPDEEFSLIEPLDAETLLCLLRDLYAELRDAPPLADFARLPRSVDCWGAAAVNGGMARHLRDRALWEPDRDAVLSAAAAECDAYQAFWWTAGCAVSASGEVADRRRSLASLRDTVGIENWNAGRLPDFAPAHLFRAR